MPDNFKSYQHKEFIEAFKNLTQRYSRFQVWSDFVEMTACAISNACDYRFATEREELYRERSSRYEKKEFDQFVEMFSMTVIALHDNPEQDFLGEIFGLLNLNSEWHGQFFTPYHIGALMAQMQLPEKPDEDYSKDPITISDPCCGAGCLLIAFANEAAKKGINYQKRMIFYAQDIDRIAALMCYIQLSILGCQAVVKIGNTLTDPLTAKEELDDNIWLTPMLVEETCKIYEQPEEREEKKDA